VPFAEDQDAVGEFGSGGPDEAFGEAVRPWTTRWDLHRVDPGGPVGFQKSARARDLRRSAFHAAAA
jgi:hypothetical protein